MLLSLEMMVRLSTHYAISYYSRKSDSSQVESNIFDKLGVCVNHDANEWLECGAFVLFF